MAEQFLQSVSGQILNKLDSGVYRVNSKFDILELNPQILEWYPDSTESIGKKCYELFHKLSSVCPACPAVAALKTGKAKYGILNGPYDNANMNFEISALPIQDVNNREDNSIALVLKDITKFRTTKDLEGTLKLLKREKQVFETLFHTLPYPMYLKDRESRFVMMNQSMADKFKFKDIHEMIGKTDFDIFTADHARPAFNDEQDIMASKIPKIGYEEKETPVNMPTTYCLSTKMPIINHDGEVTGVLGISVDITQRKKWKINFGLILMKLS